MVKIIKLGDLLRISDESIKLTQLAQQLIEREEIVIWYMKNHSHTNVVIKDTEYLPDVTIDIIIPPLSLPNAVSMIIETHAWIGRIEMLVPTKQLSELPIAVIHDNIVILGFLAVENYAKDVAKHFEKYVVAKQL